MDGIHPKTRLGNLKETHDHHSLPLFLIFVGDYDLILCTSRCKRVSECVICSARSLHISKKFFNFLELLLSLNF